MSVSGEALRKSVHIGFGFAALLLRILSPWQAMAGAVVAIGFNAWLLPRLTGRRLERDADRRRGFAAGIVLYPVAVLLLLLVFPRRPEIVAAAWGVLAFGDGAATLIGRAAGGRPLPWNSEKTLGGSLAFVVCGTAGAAALFHFVQSGAADPVPFGLVLAGCTVATLMAAVVESYPTGINDNLTVPFVVAAVLYLLAFVEPGAFSSGGPGFLHRAVPAVAINAALAVLFRHRGWVTGSGTAAGFAIGTAMWVFGGWQGFVLLLGFFVLGNGATRIGFRRKDRLGIAQESRGARSARHAVANTGVAVFLTMLAALAPGVGDVFRLAAAAALATAACDTVSSEIGQLFRRGTILITTLRPVPPGTEGAVSPAGTVAGAASAALMAAIAWRFGWAEGVAAMGVVTAAGFIGATVESYIGATLVRHHRLDNEAVNFLNTAIGALVAVGLGRWWLWG